MPSLQEAEVESLVASATGLTARVEQRTEEATILAVGSTRLACVVLFERGRLALRGACAAARASADATRFRAAPVVIAPRVTPALVAAAGQHRVSYLDVVGNGHIVAPGFFFHVEGRKAPTARGRPSLPLYGATGSVVRALLVARRPYLRQRELATDAGVDPGHASRVVRALAARGHIAPRGRSGPLRVVGGRLLLEDLRDVCPARSRPQVRGSILTRQRTRAIDAVGSALAAEGIRFARGGSAALDVDAGGGFILYVDREPDPRSLATAGFRAEARGAVRLVVDPHAARTAHPVASGAVDAALAYADLALEPQAIEAGSALLLGGALAHLR